MIIQHKCNFALCWSKFSSSLCECLCSFGIEFKSNNRNLCFFGSTATYPNLLLLFLLIRNTTVFFDEHQLCSFSDRNHCFFRIFTHPSSIRTLFSPSRTIEGSVNPITSTLFLNTAMVCSMMRFNSSPLALVSASRHRNYLLNQDLGECVIDVFQSF